MLNTKRNGRKLVILFLLLGFLLSLPAISAATMMPVVELYDNAAPSVLIATVQISYEEVGGSWQYDYYFSSNYNYIIEVGFSNEIGNSPAVDIGALPGPPGAYNMGVKADIFDTSTYVNGFYLSAGYGFHITATYDEELTEQILLARGMSNKVANASVTYPVDAEDGGEVPVPEPGILLLFASGLVSLALFRRKRSSS